MNIEELDSFMKELSFDTIIHNNQIDNWLNKIFYIDRILEKEKNDIYLIYYFVLLAQLIEEGLIFCSRVVEICINSDAPRIKYLKLLIKSITKIKSIFSEKEIEYIFYLRHTACHIFQTGYEYQFINGKLKTNRKDKNISDVKDMLFDVLEMHKNEEAFKTYVHVKIHPYLRDLFDEITNLRSLTSAST